MPPINKGTAWTHYPPPFIPWFYVTFPSGFPDADAREWVLEAIDLTTFNFQRLGEVVRDGVQINVYWLNEADLDLDDTDSFSVFARTTQVAPAGGLHQFEISILEDLHSRGGAFGGKDFYQESIAHELAHVVLTLLISDAGYTLETLQATLTPILGLTEWDTGPWESRTLEAACEIFKDTYLPRAYRRYSNRTNGRLAAADRDAFIELFQAPHYEQTVNDVRHRLTVEDYVWQQAPMDDHNESTLPFVSIGLSGDGDWVPDSYLFIETDFNIYLDEGKFDAFYIVAEIEDVVGWDPDVSPNIVDGSSYDDITGSVPAWEFTHSFVGGANFNGASPEAEYDRGGPFPHEDPFPASEPEEAVSDRHWFMAADALSTHPDRAFVWTSAKTGRRFWAFRVPIPPLATWAFFNSTVWMSSNTLPGVGSSTVGGGTADKWGRFSPFLLLPHPNLETEGFPGTIELLTPQQGRVKSRRRIRGSSDQAGEFDILFPRV